MYNENPPFFPEFYWNDYYWITSVIMTSFKGFQIRNGLYGSLSSNKTSDGTIHLAFKKENQDDSKLTQDEIDTVRWVINNEKGVHDALMSRLLEEYPAMRKLALECFDSEEEANEFVPPLTTIDEIKKLCGIVAIYVYPLKSDKPCIGIELGSTWSDNDHGVGVLLHGNNVVECGSAHIVF
ncbi:MAG: hypothetical protein WBF90_03790 [Rivularia sp. (in: cyanobacteria)]|jgi:hypothetical protein